MGRAACAHSSFWPITDSLLQHPIKPEGRLIGEPVSTSPEHALRSAAGPRPNS